MAAEASVGASSSARHRLGYRPALDGFRAAAVLDVLAAHTGVGFFRGAAIGVDMFLVLSGFLITSLLLEELSDRGRVRYSHFYARRALRLLPALMALIFVCIVIVLAFKTPPGVRHNTLRGALPALLYFSNWARVAGWNLGYLDHTWSVSVEEQFYLAWPMTLLMLRRRLSSRSVALVCGASAALALATTALRFLRGANPEVLYNGTESHALPVLLVGALVALLLSPRGYCLGQNRARLNRSAVIGLIVIAVCAVGIGGHSAFYFLGGYGVVAIACAVVVASIQDQRSALARLFSVRPLRALGRISYGVYLWHFPIYFFVAPRFFPRRGVIVIPMMVASSLAVAAVSYWTLEKPFLRLKDRFNDRSRMISTSESGSTAI